MPGTVCKIFLLKMLNVNQGILDTRTSRKLKNISITHMLVITGYYKSSSKVEAISGWVKVRWSKRGGGGNYLFYVLGFPKRLSN